MGCDSYGVSSRRSPGSWTTASIKFSESDDNYGCLCTFPHNYQSLAGEGVPDAIDNDTVRSFAMLGVLVVLAHQGQLMDEYNYIPQSVPDWIRKRIEELLPLEAGEPSD